jgi:glutamyl-Q tRNA(Asp) synthetase
MARGPPQDPAPGQPPTLPAGLSPGPDGPRYPGTCRTLPAAARAARIAAGTPYALRLDMAAALRAVPGPLHFHERGQGCLTATPEAFGDVVLARKDSPASYHLCVTHDDAAQGVTLVTRGIDLLPATSLHRLLQALFGWPVPEYAHHPLLLGADGRRLAKREGAPAIADLRSAGHSAATVHRMAGFLDGP